MASPIVLEAAAAALAAAAAWLVVRPWSEARAIGRGRVTTAGRTVVVDRLRRRGVDAIGRMGIGPASRRRRARERLRVIQALGALAAELEAGQPPVTALMRAGGSMRRPGDPADGSMRRPGDPAGGSMRRPGDPADGSMRRPGDPAGGPPSVWPSALAAAQLGGDVVTALAIDARGDAVLRQLAACWQVGADTGAGLALSVGRLAATARAAEDVRVDLEGQLAGPRASARLLALLPLVGIGFGMLLGSDPLAWLLGTAPGRLCLLAGVMLTVAGTVWTGRIAARVERLL